MLKPAFLVFWLPVIFSGLALSEAFQTAPSGVLGKTQSVQSFPSSTLRPAFHRRSLEANLKGPKKKEEDKEKIGADGMKMFAAYANPMRNPNSIFVYLFMALYALGTYSEAHHGM